MTYHCWPLLIIAGLLYCVSGFGAAPSENNFYSNFINFSPASATAVIGKAKDLDCDVRPLIDRITQTVNSNNVDMEYRSMVSMHARARYDVPTDIGEGQLTASTTVDWPGLSNITCVRVKLQFGLVECDFASFVQQLASNVTLSAYWNGPWEKPQMISKPEKIESTRITFRLPSVLRVSNDRVNVCCHLNFDVPSLRSLLEKKPRKRVTNCETVLVGYLPVTPEISDDNIVITDFKSLSFRWTLPSENEHPTSHTAYYLSLDRRNYEAYREAQERNKTGFLKQFTFQECPKNSATTLTCTLSGSLFDPSAAAYAIKVVSENDFGQSSCEKLVEATKFSAPSPVRELYTVQKIGEDRVEIRWRHPLWTQHIKFNISVTCTDGPQICDSLRGSVRSSQSHIRSLEKIEEMSLEIYRLHPNTKYSVSVRAQYVGRILNSGGRDLATSWSLPFSVPFQTLRHVPRSALPLTCEDCFSLSRSVPYKVTIYWKKIPRDKQHYDITKYRLREVIDDKIIDVDSGSSSAVIDYPSSNNNSQVSVWIIGHCTVDNVTWFTNHSSIASFILLLNQTWTSDIVILVANETFYEIMWAEVSGAVHYTLFWCKPLKGGGENNLCKDDISWQKSATHSALLPRSDLDFRDVIIGVSVNMGTYLTGILWSDCAHYDSNQAPVIRLIVTESSVTLRIVPAMCQRISRAFLLVYCEGSSNNRCAGTSVVGTRNITLQLPHVDVELNDVRRGQEYTVVVYDMSSPSQPSLVHVEQVKLAAGRGFSLSFMAAGLVAIVALVIVTAAIVAVMLKTNFITQCIQFWKMENKGDISVPIPPTAAIDPKVYIDNENFKSADANYLQLAVINNPNRDSSSQVAANAPAQTPTRRRERRVHFAEEPSETDNLLAGEDGIAVENEESEAIEIASYTGGMLTYSAQVRNGHKQRAASPDSASSTFRSSEHEIERVDAAARTDHSESTQLLPSSHRLIANTPVALISNEDTTTASSASPNNNAGIAAMDQQDEGVRRAPSSAGVSSKEDAGIAPTTEHDASGSPLRTIDEMLAYVRAKFLNNEDPATANYSSNQDAAAAAANQSENGQQSSSSRRQMPAYTCVDLMNNERSNTVNSSSNENSGLTTVGQHDERQQSALSDDAQMLDYTRVSVVGRGDTTSGSSSSGGQWIENTDDIAATDQHDESIQSQRSNEDLPAYAAVGWKSIGASASSDRQLNEERQVEDSGVVATDERGECLEMPPSRARMNPFSRTLRNTSGTIDSDGDGQMMGDVGTDHTADDSMSPVSSGHAERYASAIVFSSGRSNSFAGSEQYLDGEADVCNYVFARPADSRGLINNYSAMVLNSGNVMQTSTSSGEQFSDEEPAHVVATPRTASPNSSSEMISSGEFSLAASADAAALAYLDESVASVEKQSELSVGEQQCLGVCSDVQSNSASVQRAARGNDASLRVDNEEDDSYDVGVDKRSIAGSSNFFGYSRAFPPFSDSS